MVQTYLSQEIKIGCYWMLDIHSHSKGETWSDFNIPIWMPKWEKMYNDNTKTVEDNRNWNTYLLIEI